MTSEVQTAPKIPKTSRPKAKVRPKAPKIALKGVEHWRPLIEQHPDWPVDTMMRIMACESRGNPVADNPRSSATGLLQVLGGSTDPATNVAQAHSIWRRQGLAAWRACL
jgi:hypothetical protein